MRAVTFEELITATGGTPVGVKNRSAEVSRIEIDSRRLRSGDLFWALEGVHLDGHDFIDEATGKNAAIVIAEEGRTDVEPRIEVADSLMAFWDFAEWYRRQFDALVIGVTGSVGKTTTRRMIHAVLSARFDGVESPENYNNEYGVPLSLLQLDSHHDFGVFELGASHVGEIADLTEVARPEIGVLTSIGPAHIEEFGSYENIINTKAELIERIPESGFVVLNGDDRNVRQIAERAQCPVILVGERKHNDIIATNVTVQNDVITFSVDDAQFTVPAVGRHHIQAGLIAIAIGRQVDMSDDEIQNGLNQYSPLNGRSQIMKIGPWTVINDTYNANPMSMSAACQTLKNWETSGKKFLLVGDMLALGEWSDDFHQLLGEEVTRSKIDHVIAYGSQAANVARSARKHGMDAGCLGTCTQDELVMFLLDLWLEPKDVILLKGSRGMAMESFLPRLQELADRQTVQSPQESIQRKVA